MVLCTLVSFYSASLLLFGPTVAFVGCTVVLWYFRCVFYSASFLFFGRLSWFHCCSFLVSFVSFSPFVSRLSVAFVAFPVARFFPSFLLVFILCSCGGVRLPGEVGESGPYGGASSPWWSVFYLLFWLLGIALHPVANL